MERRQVVAWFTVLGVSHILRGRANFQPSSNKVSYLPSCLHPNGKWVALPGPKGDPIELWDILTGERVGILPNPQTPKKEPPGEFGRRGLGTYMSRNGQYSTFHGALFIGKEALVGAWTGYDERYAWIVGLPESSLSKRHIRVDWYSKPDERPKAISQTAWNCLASLFPREDGSFTHDPWLVHDPLNSGEWTVYRQGSAQALAKLRIPSDFRSTGSTTTYATFSPSGNCIAFTWHGCNYDMFSFQPVHEKPTGRVVVWPWKTKSQQTKTFVIGQGDIDRIHPIDEARWLVVLHQHTFSTRSLIRLGKTKLIELPSQKEFVPPIVETQPCQVGVDLARGLLVTQYGAGTVRCYDLATRRMTRLMTAFMPHQGLLAWGADSRYLLAARPLGHACLWDRRKPTSRVEGISEELIRPPVYELGMDTRCLLWLPGRDILIQGCEDGSVRAFKRSQLRYIPDSECPWGMAEPRKPHWRIPASGRALRELAIVPGTELLLGLEQEGRLVVWSLRNGHFQATIQAHPLRANALVVDEEGKRLFTGGHDGVRSWSFPKLQPGPILNTETHWVSALALRGNWLAAGCLDGVIRLYDITTGQLRWKTEAHDGWVGGLTFSPSGALTSGGEDCTVALWDVDKGGLTKRSVAGGNLPLWSPDGSLLAVYAHDRVRLLTPEMTFVDREQTHLKLDWADDYT